MVYKRFVSGRMRVWRDANRHADVLVRMAARLGANEAPPGPSRMESALAAFYIEFELEVDEAACRTEYRWLLDHEAPEGLEGVDLWVRYTKDLFREKLHEPHGYTGEIHDNDYDFCLDRRPVAILHNVAADRAYALKHGLGYDPVRDRGVDSLVQQPGDDDNRWVRRPEDHVAWCRSTEFAVAFLRALFPDTSISRKPDRVGWDPDAVECSVASHTGKVYKLLFDGASLMLQIREEGYI